MNIYLYSFFYYLLLLSSIVCAQDIYFPSAIYNQINDINHPTFDDYRLIQNYIDKGDYQAIKRKCGYFLDPKLIGSALNELPESGMINVNCDKNEKENCVIMYSSFNRAYPQGLRRVIKQIGESDFKGHILYRLGGWPNTEGGSLVLSHIPYAFKVCFFKEAQRLGYKRVLWLDTAVIPVASLNEIFKMIKKDGHFIAGPNHVIGPWMNSEAAAAFGMTLEQTLQIPSCAAFVIGIDLENETSAGMIDSWYNAASNGGFYSARSDQSALSIILYKLGISDFVSLDRIPHREIGERIKPDSLFYIDRLTTHVGK